MSIDSLNNIKDALSKLNKTQSLIKGIRLGISTISSAQNQNIEEILKLINADLFEISTIISGYIDIEEIEKAKEAEKLKESEQFKELENNTSQKENETKETIQNNSEHSATEIFNSINQNFENEINNDNN